MKNKFYKIPVTIYVAASSKQMARNILAAQLDDASDDTLNAAFIDEEDFCGVTGWVNMGRPDSANAYEKDYRAVWGSDFAAGEERHTVRK